MDDGKLIELVRQNDCIYNKYSAGYKNTEAKSYIWATIAQEVGAIAEQCIRRWTSLRDRYVRESKRADAPSGSGASSGREWPFFEAMSFLKPHIAARPTRCNANVLLTTCENSTEAQDSTSLISSSPLLTSTPLSSPTESENLELPNRNSLSSSQGKKRRHDAADADFKEAVQAFKSLCQSRQHQLSTRDPAVEGFGQMISSIINGMPEHQKVRAMKAAMDAVISVQMESN